MNNTELAWVLLGGYMALENIKFWSEQGYRLVYNVASRKYRDIFSMDPHENASAGDIMKRLYHHYRFGRA